MNRKDEEVIRKSISNYCKPLITMLLQKGISNELFISATKDLFVDLASEEFGVRGRPANISRISVMTGLSRKEVKKIRNRISSNRTEALRAASPVGRVLAAWHNDPDFLDSDGNPKPLSYEGSKLSFCALARRYVGDIPVSTLLKELEENNLVDESKTGKIRPIRQSYILASGGLNSLARLGEVAGELGGTVVKNHTNDDEKLFERRVLTGHIRKSDVKAFHALVRSQGSKFLQFLESWLFERGLSDADISKRRGNSRAGVGIYFFEEEVDQTSQK